jgi:hypothetical protein
MNDNAVAAAQGGAPWCHIDVSRHLVVLHSGPDTASWKITHTGCMPTHWVK